MRAAALPCSATRRVAKDGADPADAGRRAARVLAANQARPTQAVAAASPNPIQPRTRAWTSVKPSQKPSPTMPAAGWANSASARAPGTSGACLAATSEAGAHGSRAPRREGAVREAPAAGGP